MLFNHREINNIQFFSNISILKYVTSLMVIHWLRGSDSEKIRLERSFWSRELYLENRLFKKASTEKPT